MTDSQSPQNNLSLRQLAKLLKKFHIQDGDILALKHESPDATIETIEKISKAFERLHKNVLIIVVEDFNDMTVLNETEMSKHGWYRLKSIRRLIKEAS